MKFLIFIVTFPFLFILVTWVMASLQLKATFFQKRQQLFYSYDPNVQLLAPPLVAFISNAYQELTAQGFQLTAYLYHEGFTTGMRVYITSFHRHETGDRAMAVVMQSSLQGVDSIKTSYIEFTTHYLDGIEVSTNNCKTPSGTHYRRPTKFVFQFPGQRTAAELYHSHRALLGVYGSRTAPVRNLDPANTIVELQQVMAMDLDYQRERGLYWFDANEDKYRATWFGAFKMVSGLLPIIVQVRKAIGRRRNNAALKMALQRQGIPQRLSA